MCLNLGQFLALLDGHSRLRVLSKHDNGPCHLGAYRAFAKGCDRGVSLHPPGVRMRHDFIYLYEGPANRLLNTGLTFVLVLDQKENSSHCKKQDEQQKPSGDPKSPLHLTLYCS